MASYWLKIATFSFSLFSGPAGGDLVGISWRCLMLVKLEWLGYRMVRKLWRYVKPFSYNTSVLRTDERTDRRTDRQNCYINIARQHQCADVSVSISVTWIGSTYRPCGAKNPKIGPWVKTILAELPAADPAGNYTAACMQRQHDRQG